MNVKTNRYRTLAIASALVAALGGVSCGGDGTTDPLPPPPPPPPPAPVAPVTVRSIPAQVMTAGESVAMDVSPFFSDPDGGTLTYTAPSSAEAVLTVSLTGSNLTITAVAPGTATVTVMATDPGGLSATQSAEVTVEAANQAPEAVGTIPPQSLNPGQSRTIDVSSYFRDPDGDVLSYAVAASNALATASVTGSRVTVIGVAAGSATVTVTARDPGGLSATQSVDITVTATAGFRDDFDSAASLDDWEISSADATVANGLLRLTPTTGDRLGIAERVLDSPLTEWTIRARMGRAADEGTVRLYWFTGNADFPAIGVSLGPADDDNYRFLFWDPEERGWFFSGEFSGSSDAVRDAPGESTDLTIGRDGEDFFVTAEDADLIRFTPTETFVRALRNVTGIWLAGTENGSAVHFDWIDVAGTESSADMSNRSGAARRLDLAHEAVEASAAAKPIRLKR